jgi:hypothetical protein
MIRGWTEPAAPRLPFAPQLHPRLIIIRDGRVTAPDPLSRV